MHKINKRTNRNIKKQKIKVELHTYLILHHDLNIILLRSESFFLSIQLFYIIKFKFNTFIQ